MSDLKQRTPTTGAGIDQQLGYEAPSEPTGWAGMALFGAVMMIMLGAFQAIVGFVAIFDEGYYLVGQSGLVVDVDYTTWGWVHLVVGLVALAAGLGLMRGATWARVVGICIALVSAILNFVFIAAFPFWAITMITIDVLVIYAIAAHGRELKRL
jgi:hypothetical protein